MNFLVTRAEFIQELYFQIHICDVQKVHHWSVPQCRLRFRSGSEMRLSRTSRMFVRCLFRKRFRVQTDFDVRRCHAQDAPSVVAERTRRSGALWALCHLGDAAVQNPGDINCSEVRICADAFLFVTFDVPPITKLFMSLCGEIIFRSCCHRTTCRWGLFWQVWLHVNAKL